MKTNTELNKPKINLEFCSTDNSIAPITKVQIMSPEDFETFTAEWLYSCKKNMYVSIQNIGGAGDKGRDVIAYKKDGSIDYYQCKHYASPLAPSNYYLELGKLCYYTYTEEIQTPSNYYIVASNDVGPKLLSLLENGIKVELLKNWDKYCKKNITKSTEIELTDELSNYINNFDFSIIKTYPMIEVVDEHLDTIYGKIRFGGKPIHIPGPLHPPAKVKKNELTYITALLEAYSDDVNIEINTIEHLEQYKIYYSHFQRQRRDYYAAETIRRFVRDTFTNSESFEVLKEEIYDSIIDVCERQYDTGYERLNNVLTHVTKVSLNKCPLVTKIDCIGQKEKKGTCHILVNEKKLRWVIEDEKHI